MQREAEKSLKKLIENPYNRQNFVNFLLRVFPGADIWTQAVKNLPIDEKFKDKILEAEVIGEYQEEEIAFLAIKVSSPEKLRKYHRDFVARYLEEEGKEGALVAFYSDDSPVWRLSYIQMEYEKSKEDGRIKKKLTNFRRFSFIVGEGKASKTTLLQLSEFLNLENPTAAQLLEIFSVDSLNERFFRGVYKKICKPLANNL